MARVVGLGHVGIYTHDLERLVAFYRDFLGMTVTKQSADMGMVFLSSDPRRSDHEIALMRARPDQEPTRNVEQISMRVETLDDLRTFHRKLTAEGYKIDRVVSHCSAIGCYYFDPDGNRCEVFWLTSRACWVPALEPIDPELPDEDIMAVVERQFARFGHVPVGGTFEPASAR